MIDLKKTALLCVSPLLVGAGLYVAGPDAGIASASAGPLRCEIVAAKANGMTRLESVARADSRVSGSYLLRVSGSGANIVQGGEFDAGMGQKTTLGTVMLGAGGKYDAVLEIEANGHTASCKQRIG